MYVKGRYQPVQLLCGLKRLPGPILSYNNRLKVEFRGIYGGKREDARGFKLNFEFVRRKLSLNSQLMVFMLILNGNFQFQTTASDPASKSTTNVILSSIRVSQKLDFSSKNIIKH